MALESSVLELRLSREAEDVHRAVEDCDKVAKLQAYASWKPLLLSYQVHQVP